MTCMVGSIFDDIHAQKSQTKLEHRWNRDSVAMAYAWGIYGNQYTNLCSLSPTPLVV